MRDRPSTAPRSTVGAGAIASRSPIGDGRKTDFATAQAETRHALLLPNSTLARSSTLRQTWIQPAFDEVALVYGTNDRSLVVDQYRSQRSDQSDPAGSLQEEMQATSASARIGEVNGRPALITEAGTDISASNPADVIFLVDGIEVNVFSNDYSAEDLVDVAETISILRMKQANTA